MRVCLRLNKTVLTCETVSLKDTDSSHSDTVIIELDQISPLPNEDNIHDILYEEVQTVLKG